VHVASSSAASSSKAANPSAHNPRFTFGGDAEDSDSEEEDANGDSKGDEEEEDDDLSLAFSILELARVGYEKLLKDGVSASLKTLDGEVWSFTMIQSQLAEALNDLADVGLESGELLLCTCDCFARCKVTHPLSLLFATSSQKTFSKRRLITNLHWRCSHRFCNRTQDVWPTPTFV
jgi:HAT1-interacting factor 1